MCNKVTSNEVLGNLGESTVVQVRIRAVCLGRAFYRQSRSVYSSLQEVYSSLRMSIVSLRPSRAIYGSLVQPTCLQEVYSSLRKSIVSRHQSK